MLSAFYTLFKEKHAIQKLFSSETLFQGNPWLLEEINVLCIFPLNTAVSLLLWREVSTLKIFFFLR